ncbi:MAG: hypothetical protein DHS20C18_32850 [Saprospiraceae bacterium]|nr:MAG: hypothetical protein DHS20C18_32850 [Saprospiraceae bacterium]
MVRLLIRPQRGRTFINIRGHYSLAVNGTNDPVHLFFDYKGHELVEDLVREIKKASNVEFNEGYLFEFFD